MKELKIIIAGEASTGKSTMLAVIERLLKDEGYNVELALEGTTELLDYGSEAGFRKAMNKNGSLAEKVMKERKITLTSKQLARGSQG